jgi:hypothetical protein
MAAEHALATQVFESRKLLQHEITEGVRSHQDLSPDSARIASKISRESMGKAAR